MHQKPGDPGNITPFLVSIHLREWGAMHLRKVLQEQEIP